jgi:hypothetical protein
VRHGFDSFVIFFMNRLTGIFGDRFPRNNYGIATLTFGFLDFKSLVVRHGFDSFVIFFMNRLTSLTN